MIRLGYHPATFPGQGIEKMIAALPTICAEGWDGLEYSARVFEGWFDRPAEVRAMLQNAGTDICGLYYTCAFADDTDTAQWLEQGRRVISFCRGIGCHLVMIDGGGKLGGEDKGVRSERIESIAEAANEMGRRCLAAGLTCSWHQHWGTIFELREPFERLLALTDPDLVKFTPDTAQLSLGDFDVLGTFRAHAGRMVYVHFKDLGPDRRFTELGTGLVDFPGVWGVLREAGFSGWVVVDLDYTSLDPAQSCHLNKAYLNDVLGIRGVRDLRMARQRSAGHARARRPAAT